MTSLHPRLVLGRGALVLALAHMAPAYAQLRPDAGSVDRDVDQQRRLEAPRASPRLSTEPARPALKADDSQRFAVASLKISGNAAFPSDTLLALVRGDLVGKTVTLKELQDAAAKITAYYRERGYLVARAYVPAQRIPEAGAEIEIAVLEGLLGSVTIDNRSRLSDSTVARFTAPLKAGAPLTLESFERPVLLLSDQAGVGGVNPVLKAGAATGTSDLALELAPRPLATGQVELDNYGNRFTGQNRLSGQINLNSPFGLGDSFSARLIESFDGLWSATLRAAVPVGGDGWAVGGSYSDTRYHLGQSFETLQASGEATSASAYVSYPIVRKQKWNLNAALAHEERKLEDRVASVGTVTPKQARTDGLTLSGDVRDPFAERSVFVWSVTGIGGRLSIDSPAASALDAATVATQGSYRKGTLSLLYLQGIGERWSVYGSFLGQRASKNLDSSEKFALGGAQGVRSYPVGEAAGDEGELLTLELRYALPQFLNATPSVALFLDQGRTRISKNQVVAGNNERRLGAAGLGFTLAKSADYSARLYWAAKTSGGPATADNDRSSRGWLQVVKYF